MAPSGDGAGGTGLAEQAFSYLLARAWLRFNYTGLTGNSSDAMVLGAFTGEGPYITDYPLDRGDWRRCLLAYALAPEWLRDRMRPTMRVYRQQLRPEDRRIGFRKWPRTDYVLEALETRGTYT